MRTATSYGISNQATFKACMAVLRLLDMAFYLVKRRLWRPRNIATSFL
jgi:hypothetical protein